MVDTKELTALRRAALYNIKVKNAGLNDYFGRDIKKEKELEIERQKIKEILRSKFDIKKADEILLKVDKNET